MQLAQIAGLPANRPKPTCRSTRAADAFERCRAQLAARATTGRGGTACGNAIRPGWSPVRIARGAPPSGASLVGHGPRRYAATAARH